MHIDLWKYYRGTAFAVQIIGWSSIILLMIAGLILAFSGDGFHIGTIISSSIACAFLWISMQLVLAVFHGVNLLAKIAENQTPSRASSTAYPAPPAAPAKATTSAALRTPAEPHPKPAATQPRSTAISSSDDAAFQRLLDEEKARQSKIID